MKCFAVFVVLLFAALSACADSIPVNTFALQENPLRLEALGPGLNPVLAPMVIHGGQRGLVFDTSLGPIGSVVFSSTINLMGLQYTLDPITIQCSATCGVGYGFLVPMSYKMVRGTLSLTLNGVTETYDFRHPVQRQRQRAPHHLVAHRHEKSVAHTTRRRTLNRNRVQVCNAHPGD